MEFLWLIANIELLGIILATVAVGLGLIVTAALLAASGWSWGVLFPIWTAEAIVIAVGFPYLTDLMDWPAAWLVVHGFTLL